MLQLGRKFLKVNFGVSHKKQQNIIVSKAKDLDQIVFILFGRETEISHGVQVLSTNDNRAWKCSFNERKKQEEITPQVPSLDPSFGIFIDLCSCDFQAVGSFTAQVNN